MKVSTLIGLLFLLFGSTTALSEVSDKNIAPNFDHNFIVGYQHSGRGCPQNSVYIQTINNNGSILVDYSEMRARADNYNQRVSTGCRLSLQLDVPRGYQVSFSNVNQRGSAYASDNGAQGSINIQSKLQYARYSVQLTNRRQRGPFNSNYSFTDTANSRDEQWTDCNRNRNRTSVDLTTDLLAETFSSNSVFSFDGSQNNHDTRQQWNITWRRCDGGGGGNRRWSGQCMTELETLWGDNISDHWGYSEEYSQGAAIDAARSESVNRCMSARNNNNIFKCTTVHSKCTATQN
jgi:hypothetical protein